MTARRARALLDLKTIQQSNEIGREVCWEEESGSMYIYQVPHASGKRPQVFISVIDASGSMGSYWESLVKYFNQYVPKDNAVTITFDTAARLVPDNTLKPNINSHGGGGTNITAAFEMMDMEIAKIDRKEMITILFISDGQDNNLDTLQDRLRKLKGNQGRTITFICLGIQSQFPTFLSMHLREVYHNGLSSIPALYLIEYFSDAAMFNKFDTMKEHFTHKRQLAIKPPVILFPWVSPMSQAYEGTWFLTPEAVLTIDGKEVVTKTEHMDLESILELFRGYVQELQMQSLTKHPALKENAAKGLETMKQIMAQYKAIEGIDMMDWVEDAHLLKVKFYERTKKQKLRHNQFRLKAYIENLESLSKGAGVQEMSEWEAAKKIGVGTITGTYTQKALSLKGFPVEMYQKVRDDFIRLLQTTKLNPGSEQAPSEVLQQTLKDVLMEERLGEGLANCDSQFDLIETLPVVGLAMKLKRYAGSVNDPWLTEVQAITRQHKGVDSIHLLQNKFKLAWTEADEPKLDYVNALLPLAGPKEEDLYPLLSHGLFHLLMTHIVAQTIDAHFPEAYLALLANTLLYLTLLPASEWRDSLTKRVLQTTHLVYGRTEEYCKYAEALLHTPEVAVLCAEKSTTGCSDLAKPFIHLMALHNLSKITREQAGLVLEHIYIAFFGQLVDSKKYMENMKVMGDSFLDKVKEGIVQQFNKYNTLGEMKRDVEVTLATVSTDLSYCPVVVNTAKLERLDQKITLKTLNFVYELFMAKLPSEEDYLYWLHTAIHSRGKKLSEVPRKMEEIKMFFFNAFKKDLISASTANVYGDLREGFLKKFKEEHMYLTPLSVTKLKEYCDQKGLEITQFAYVKEHNLIKNACMCPKCPFYLKPQERLMHHLSTWSEKCPKCFHKTVKRNIDKSPEEILEKVLQGELARDKPTHKLTLEEFNSNKDEAITYIKLLKEEYKKIIEDESKYTEELKAIENTIGKAQERHEKKSKKRGGSGGQGRGRGNPQGRGKQKQKQKQKRGRGQAKGRRGRGNP